MLGLIIELTLSGALGALALIGMVGAAGGYFFYSFRASKATVKADAVRQWSEVADALQQKVGLLETQIDGLKGEHERCQLKVNNITAFNLRLQAREARYQRTINRLERKAGVEITDFNEIEAPEDSTFR